MATVWERVRTHALSLPEAYEDHPWGENVAKVGPKVFVFLGSGEPPHGPGMSVKLDDSHRQALMARGATPTGYGLGRSGWVSLPLKRGCPPVAVLLDWIEESYRLVAPKKLAATLDARRRANR